MPDATAERDKLTINFEMVCEACRNGEIDKLESWKLDLPDLNNLSSSHLSPHEYAAIHGQLETLAWILDKSGQPADLVYVYHALCQAARSKQLETVQWISTTFPEVFADSIETVLQSAARSGSIPVFHFAFMWKSRQKTSNDFRPNDRQILRKAAEQASFASQRSFLQWLLFDNDELLLKMLSNNNHWITQLPEEFQAPMHAAANTLQHLRRLKLKLSSTTLSRCLLSPACQKLLETGMPVTVPELEKLLRHSELSTRHRVL